MLPHSLTRRSRALAAASLPALAAAAVLAWPCDCPDHVGLHGGATAAAPAAMQHEGMHTMAADERGPVAQSRSSATDDGAGAPSDFEVGTPERPTVSRGPRGPLWSTSRPSKPGRASHGSFAEITVAEQLDALRTADRATGQTTGDDPAADRAAVLTTAQATKKLSKKCQKLLRAKVSKLRKADRKRRSACLAQRRKLVAASKSQPTDTTGVAAPSAPVQGPKPTATPPASEEPAPQTTPDTPSPTTPVPTTPEKVYAAAGVRPTDTDPAKWILTRSSAKADIVNFELDNTDRQVHNLWIAPGDASGAVTGPLVEVIGDLAEGQRKAVDVALKPGIYILICTIPGHGSMQAKFTVFAP